MDRALRDLELQLLSDAPETVATLALQSTDQRWADSLTIGTPDSVAKAQTLLEASRAQLPEWEQAMIGQAARFVDAPATPSFAQTCSAYLAADSLMASASGPGSLPFVTLTLNLISGQVEIGITGEASAAVKSLVDKYPDEVIVTQDKYGVRELTTAHRSNDTNGFSAGDAIFLFVPVSAIGYCTLNFKLHNPTNNTNFMVTAGHCALGTDHVVHPGGTVYNGSDLRCGTGLNGTQPIGTLTSDLYKTAYNADIAAVTGGSLKQANMWTGQPCIGTSEATVVGYEAPVNNGQFGFSGTYTGQVNGQIVSPQTYCAGDNEGGYSCNLWMAAPTGPGRLCQGGDSGGPVFGYNTSSSVFATGIIHAAVAVGGVSYCEFTDLGVATYLYGSTLVTGP